MPPAKSDDLLKRPLYVYDLPPEILNTLRPFVEGEKPAEAAAAATTTTTQTGGAPAAPSAPSDGQDALSKAASTTTTAAASLEATDGTRTPPGSASCALCGASFGGSAERQRQHVKSDWHGYNVKQRMRGRPPVGEADFERLLEELDESISGSDSSSTSSDSDDEEDGTKLSALLRKQARLEGGASAGRQGNDDDDDGFGKRKRKRGGGGGGPPLQWFSSSALPENTRLGVYRALFTDEERAQEDLVGVLRRKQLEPSTSSSSSSSGRKAATQQDDESSTTQPSDAKSSVGPTVLICMVGGGHFAAMIVALTPETSRSKGVVERQARTVAQKTFHRYTTRRKQGGAQSANDSAKGPANSAGAAIRRANEAALEQDVRALLDQWRRLIAGCDLLFVRASGTANRRLVFGPYDGQVLRTDDARLRSIPFGTRRATQHECMRAFVELTRIKVSQVDMAAVAALEAAARAKAEEEEDRRRKQAAAAAAAAGGDTSKAKKGGPSPEEEEAAMHTGQLQALIRRSKIPAVLAYLSRNSLPPDFRFQPAAHQANHHASTPLHLAASLNSPALVSALLLKAGADPAALNGEGRPAFDLCGDRATRDAFRVARFELGNGSEIRWADAHVPSALSREDADARDQEDKSSQAEEESKRRESEMARLAREAPSHDTHRPGGRVIGSGIEVTAADRREQESRGLTPEMRMQLERERRARAAEERMKRLAGR